MLQGRGGEPVVPLSGCLVCNVLGAIRERRKGKIEAVATRNPRSGLKFARLCAVRAHLGLDT